MTTIAVTVLEDVINNDINNNNNNNNNDNNDNSPGGCHQQMSFRDPEASHRGSNRRPYRSRWLNDIELVCLMILLLLLLLLVVDFCWMLLLSVVIGWCCLWLRFLPPY